MPNRSNRSIRSITPRALPRLLAPRSLAMAAFLVLCAGAAAEPSLTITAIGSDLKSDGNGVVGLIYEADVAEYVPYSWTPAGGFTRIPGAFASGEVRASADLSALTMASDDLIDAEQLRCFNGYNPNGTLRPPPSPCPVQAISHHWTQATGWVNAGLFPRFADPVTGRMIGGTRCDFDINQPTDISGNGRYVLANGWYAVALRPDGSAALGLCGNFFPLRYDSQTDTLEQLAVQPGTTTSRADRINFDGTVMTGYDLGIIPNGGGGFDSIRRTCVWRNGVQTILDPYLGAKDNAGISGPGTVVASGGSTQFVAQQFPGQVGVRLVRWNWNGAAWVPVNLGKPVDYLDPNSGLPIEFSDLWVTGISDDGNTIVGTAQYGAPPPTLGGLRRPFIWRPSINGGRPMDLMAYLATLSPSSPIVTSGIDLTYVTGISADGDSLLVQVYDARNTCSLPARSHVTFLNGILKLSGTPVCVAPRIGRQPWDFTEQTTFPYGAPVNVFASGSFPLQYQWQREDPANPGTWNNLWEACSNFLGAWDFEGVYKSQLRVNGRYGCGDLSGRYRVIVSNSCGSVTSEPARLTINAAPVVLRQPDDVNACSGTTTAYFEFRVGGTQIPAYQWQAELPSAPGTWVNLIETMPIFDGVPTTATGTDSANLELQNVVSAAATRFRCIVINACGDVTSEPASLTACAADFNCDGTSDFFDYLDFVQAFDAGCD